MGAWWLFIGVDWNLRWRVGRGYQDVDLDIRWLGIWMG